MRKRRGEGREWTCRASVGSLMSLCVEVSRVR